VENRIADEHRKKFNEDMGSEMEYLNQTVCSCLRVSEDYLNENGNEDQEICHALVVVKTEPGDYLGMMMRKNAWRMRDKGVTGEVASCIGKRLSTLSWPAGFVGLDDNVLFRNRRGVMMGVSLNNLIVK
jgi:hypothetical protein